MEDMAAMFSGLPGFSPLMSLNLSETNAARRLLQLPMMGIAQSDVRAKFDRPDWQTTDISPEDKRIFGGVVKAMDRVFAADPKLKSMQWTPVLYTYELYKGHSQVGSDFGHLVFVDNTVTRWLLVRCHGSVKCSNGNCPLDHDYSEMVSLQAQQFFNLATYLPIPEPKWVRATFTSDEHRAVPSDFFDFKTNDTSLSSRPTRGLNPGVTHITSSNMTPCFSVEDLETLDAFLAANREKVPNEDRKKLVRVKGGAEAKAYQPKYLPLEMQEDTSRECNACKTVRKLSELSRCGGCKSALYCSRKCQVTAWPQHKKICKPSKK